MPSADEDKGTQPFISELEWWLRLLEGCREQRRELLHLQQQQMRISATATDAHQCNCNLDFH
jgi:hypothetical protein